MEKDHTLLNSALVQDEILLDIAYVLDGKFPVTPRFVHSLGALSEAIVLHEDVYFNVAFEPSALVGQGDRTKRRGTVQAELQTSQFVGQLMDSGVIKSFPVYEKIGTDVDANIASVDWLEDMFWGMEAFLNKGAAINKSLLKVLADLLEFPALLKKEAFDDVEDRFHSGDLNKEDKIAIEQLRMSLGDMQLINTYSHRMAGFGDIASYFGLNFYPLSTGIPFQIVGTDRRISRAKEIYNTLNSELEKVDQESAFYSKGQLINVPLVARIVLERASDPYRDLGNCLLEIREELSYFRKSLSSYEKEWRMATKIRDRQKLRREFSSAWEALLKKERRPKQRFLYTMWNVMKSPLKLFEKIGDPIAEKYQEIKTIDQISGLYDFWDALGEAGIFEDNRRLIQNFKKVEGDDDVWRLDSQIAKTCHEKMSRMST